MRFDVTHFAARLRDALLASVLVCNAVAHAAAAEHEFLDAAQAFRGSATVTDEHTLALHLDAAPAYHLYRERIAIDTPDADAVLGPATIPHGVMQFDEAFGKNVEVLRGNLAMSLPVTSATGDFRVHVRYQGCADEGLCYPPQAAWLAVAVRDGRLSAVRWRLDDDPAAPNAAPAPASASPAAAISATEAAPATDSARIDRALRSGSLLTISGMFLLAGLLLSFTPCVLPMVPILSSIIVGQGGVPSRSRGFALALSYTLGMAMVYTTFGVVAGLLGEGLAAALQNPWVLGTFALLLATLSLSMFGVFELQMPGCLQTRLNQMSNQLPGGRFAGVFLMGGLSALIVGPCVAAPLAGALAFISQTRDVLVGGLALFSLATGMSVPLLAVGLSAGSLLPRTGAWMNGVKTFFGILLLAVALWIASPVLPGRVLMLICGAALLVGAVYLKLFERQSGPVAGTRRLAQGAGLVLAVLGVAQLVGALSGGSDPAQPLAHLARRADDRDASHPAKELAFQRVRNVTELDNAIHVAGRTVMLDFYADWCVSCKEMAHLTFNDPVVRNHLAEAVLLQADVTANTEEDKALMRRFGLFGPPGVLFFDGQGKERTAARVIGYLPPPRFAQSLQQAGL